MTALRRGGPLDHRLRGDARGSERAGRLVVVGAGPAGIVAALEASRRGVDVVLLESGHRNPGERTAVLSRAELVDENTHATPNTRSHAPDRLDVDLSGALASGYAGAWTRPANRHPARPINYAQSV